MRIATKKFLGRSMKLSSGQSLFEVVIALGVITIILVSLVILAALSISNATFSKNKTLATRLSQETLEWLRTERDTSWDTFVSHAATPTWCLTTLSWNSGFAGPCGVASTVNGTILSREVNFSIVDSNTVQVVVLLYWNDSQGSHESRTTTTFTNWRNK